MKNKYILKIDLNSLNHLGINLYSNIPAVLSELIANSWDAEAAKVLITVEQREKIIVHDDGCGMDQDDMNNKFLTVGYERRKNVQNDQTPMKNRKVMGRKGIGKLSIFSIAKHVQIFTKKKDNKTIGLELDVEKIKEAIANKKEYHPRAIEAIPSEFKIESDSGTIIVLTELKKRISASLDENLKKRIARRFSIWSDDFKVNVNNELVSIQDRDYFDKLEYTTVYGEYDRTNFRHDREYIEERNNIIDIPPKHEIKGWIGLAKESSSLQNETDHLNKLTILVRGKVALENILDHFRLGGLYTKYLIGEIEADFLDSTESEDIATSSRQDFLQNDERFVALKTFIQNELKFVEKKRSEYKEQQAEEKAKENPAIKDWYNSLQGDTKKAAKNLFGRINQIATDEEHRKTLYKHGVLAFEHLQYKKQLNQLENLDINNLEIAVQLFSEIDDIEASWYYQITEGRLKMIRKLQENVKQDVVEKIIQKHIYNHLWLLDPTWDRATETPSMEQTVKSSFDIISKKLTKEEANGRIDIQYKKTSGKHIIIELKRSSVGLNSQDLSKQVEKYITALTKLVKNAENITGKPDIEAICLVGKLPTDLNWQEALKAKGIRVVTYQQLINDAENAYKDYLNKKSEKGRISKLLDDIENS